MPSSRIFTVSSFETNIKVSQKSLFQASMKFTKDMKIILIVKIPKLMSENMIKLYSIINFIDKEFEEEQFSKKFKDRKSQRNNKKG